MPFNAQTRLHIIIIVTIMSHVLIWISLFACQPEVLEQIHSLKELWLDNNSLQSIPGVRRAGKKIRYISTWLHVIVR